MFQEDNLVRFLNEVSVAREIIQSLELEPCDEFSKSAEKILERRRELGAFLNIYDVEEALSFKTELGRSLLKASLHPMFIKPVIARVHSVGFPGYFADGSSVALAPLLFPS